jgi:hypothetical protein
MTKAPTRKRAFQDLGLDEAGIRDISEELYRRKLDSECGAGTARRTDDAIAAGSKHSRQGEHLRQADEALS